MPDSSGSVQSCCSPIASASAAARTLPTRLPLDPLQLLLLSIASVSTAAPRLHPFQLLLPVCIRFSCCSLLASTFSCCSRLRPFQLLLPDCIRFNCCSLIASASAAAPRQLFWKIPALSTILEHSMQSSRFSK